jgi:hypothetical protein
MGVYYHPRNKKVESLLPNFWGADFYGLLYRFAIEGSRETKFDGPMPRIPYKATASEARYMACEIEYQLKRGYHELKQYLDNNGMLRHLATDVETDEFIKGFASELVCFLKNCGGYYAN